MADYHYPVDYHEHYQTAEYHVAGYHFPADYHDHYPVDCHGHYQTAEYPVADYNKCAEVGVGSPVLLPVHQDPSL